MQTLPPRSSFGVPCSPRRLLLVSHPPLPPRWLGVLWGLQVWRPERNGRHHLDFTGQRVGSQVGIPPGRAGLCSHRGPSRCKSGRGPVSAKPSCPGTQAWGGGLRRARGDGQVGRARLPPAQSGSGGGGPTALCFPGRTRLSLCHRALVCIDWGFATALDRARDWTQRMTADGQAAPCWGTGGCRSPLHPRLLRSAAAEGPRGLAREQDTGAPLDHTKLTTSVWDVRSRPSS